MSSKSLIREPELDMNRTGQRQTLGKSAWRPFASVLRGLTPRWLAQRSARSIESPRRSLDREREHFLEPWEENARR